jgi:hypothetical protein
MSGVGQSFHAWTVLSTDATAKRAASRCLCGRVQALDVAHIKWGRS